jgi:hypothetical protein
LISFVSVNLINVTVIDKISVVYCFSQFSIQSVS